MAAHIGPHDWNWLDRNNDSRETAIQWTADPVTCGGKDATHNVVVEHGIDMPKDHRSPALPLTSARLLDVLDRIYDLQATELDWLRNIGLAIRPLVDCGAGVTVHRLTLPTHPTDGGQIASVGLGNDVDTMWARFLRVVPLEILTDPWMTGPLSNADHCPTPRVRSYAAVGHAAMGLRSFTALNALDLNDRVVSVGVPAPIGGRVFWPEHERMSWERVSAHLGAAFRLRGRGAASESPGVIVDQRGRTQHVARELGSVEVSCLRDAMASVDRARRIRMSPDAVLRAWHALYGGRWSIIESTERDGRRLLVAHAPSTKPAGRRPPGHRRKLSAQEKRVVCALGKGHSNKLIAYELGLATSTVGTLLARAAAKLGCSDRIALARAGRALLPPPGRSS